MHQPRSLVLLFPLVLVSVSIAQSPPVVKPGKGLTFTTPDNAGSSIKRGKFPGRVEVRTPRGGVLSTHLFAFGPRERVSVTAFEYNDFKIDSGPGLESVLRTQINGKATLNGYLSMIGLGKAVNKVSVDVIDIGDPKNPRDDQVIKTVPISKQQITGQLQPGLSANIAGLLGSATLAQAGAEIGASISFVTCQNVIRDELNFGFDVLLRRGHSYRIKIKTTSGVKMSVAGGLATASFDSNHPCPLNLFDPVQWLDRTALSNLKQLKLPVFPFPKLNLFKLPKLGFTVSNVYYPILPEIVIPMLPPFVDLREMFTKLNLKNLPELSLKGLTQFLGLTQNLGREEMIEGAGLEVTALSLYVAEDLHEQLSDVQTQLLEIQRLLRTPPGRRDGFNKGK